MDHQDSPPLDENQEKTNKGEEVGGLTQPIKPNKKKAALTWVQDYLSRRSHSEKELLEKLIKKDFPKDEILEAIDYAKKRKWMESPEELAQKVYREWDLKNKSHQWISGYLDKKGLPFVSADSCRELEKTVYHLSKKFGKINKDNYQRASANIASKGFTFGDFKKAVEQIKDDGS